MGKTFQNFQKNSINSKKFKNSISFEIFTHLNSKLPTRILGASFDEIRHCLIQVTPHVLLFLFHVNFSSFHGPIHFLGHPKLCVSAHVGIGFFPRIGLAIHGKNTQTHVHTRPFCKQSCMRLGMRFSRENNNQNSFFCV